MDETVEHEKIHRISPSPPPERERPPVSEHCSAKRMDRGSTEDADCGGGNGGSRPGPRVNGAGAPTGGGRGSPGERAGPAPGVGGAPSTAMSPTTTTTAGVKIKQEPKEGDMKVSTLYSLYNLLQSMILLKVAWSSLFVGCC